MERDICTSKWCFYSQNTLLICKLKSVCLLDCVLSDKSLLMLENKCDLNDAFVRWNWGFTTKWCWWLKTLLKYKWAESNENNTFGPKSNHYFQNLEVLLKVALFQSEILFWKCIYECSIHYKHTQYTYLSFRNKKGHLSFHEMQNFC